MKASWTARKPPRVKDIVRLTGFRPSQVRAVVQALGHTCTCPNDIVPLSIALDATHYLSRVRHGEYQ
jgi:hypothetical protein